jgi:hypothetical protein
MKRETWKRSEIKQLKEIMANGEGLYRDRIESASKILNKSANSCYYMYYKGSKKPRKAVAKRGVKPAKVTPAVNNKTTTLTFNLVSMRVDGTKLIIEIKS